jgi:hypothetical protein
MDAITVEWHSVPVGLGADGNWRRQVSGRR